MSVLVENNATGDMYNAQFVDASNNYNSVTINFQGDTLNHRADVLVNPTPIPVPGTLELLVSAVIAGAGIGGLKRKRVK